MMNDYISELLREFKKDIMIMKAETCVQYYLHLHLIF